MKKIRSMLKFSFRDLAVYLLVMATAGGICMLLKPISDSDFHVPSIFVVAVMLISRWTTGYLFGLIASVTAVLGVNIVFTYPYYQMDFSLTGYPLTFICMFVASVVTSTLTTKVKESEKIFREAELEAARANLLRAVSHDFRTPLTGMVGSLNVVIENGDTMSREQRRELMNDAKDEAEWLINMVENLLSITRIGGDNAALHTEAQAVEEILSETTARFRRQQPGFAVSIRIPDEPLMIEADAMLIEQVLLNLLLNAAVHGKTAQKAEIEVRQTGEMAEFSVSDDGVGIDPERLPGLFSGKNPEQRTDASRGMGIGLSVCRTIVQAHGGWMRAENRPEGGACFRFAVPVSRKILLTEE